MSDGTPKRRCAPKHSRGATRDKERSGALGTSAADSGSAVGGEVYFFLLSLFLSFCVTSFFVSCAQRLNAKQSRRRCGKGERSPGADVAGVSPVPVQMWQWWQAEEPPGPS